MLALFVELGLELEALVVGFYGANGVSNCRNPRVHFECAELFGREGAITGVMIWESRVPPDSGVHVVRQIHAFLIGSGFACGAVLMHQVGARDHHGGGLGFACVHIYVVFFYWAALGFFAAPLHVDYVIVRLIELGLREIWEQVFVAAVAIHDDDFFAAVAGHFVGGFLQQLQLQIGAVGDGTGLVLGFE